MAHLFDELIKEIERGEYDDEGKKLLVMLDELVENGALAKEEKEELIKYFTVYEQRRGRFP